MRSRLPSSARRTDKAFSAHQRGFRALFDGELEPEDTRVHQQTLEIARELPRGAHAPAMGDDGVERIVRRVRTRQCDAQLRESIVDLHNQRSRKLDVSVPCQR